MSLKVAGVILFVSFLILAWLYWTGIGVKKSKEGVRNRANPGRHGIYDFLRRDTHIYMPDFSMAKVVPSGKKLKLGSTNRVIQRPKPSIIDIGPTVLTLFGLRPPEGMEGKGFLENR